MIWKKIPAVAEWTACWSPIGAVTVSPALSSGSVLDRPLGLTRPLLSKQIVRDAISPLAAVRVVGICNLNHSEQGGAIRAFFSRPVRPKIDPSDAYCYQIGSTGIPVE